MTHKTAGVLLAMLMGFGLLLADHFFPKAKSDTFQKDLTKILNARDVHIDPAELVNLIYNYNTPLRIIDVRDEAEYNLFHIIDANHADMEQIRTSRWIKSLPEQTVIVLVSNDEERATEAWRVLAEQGIENLYILAGGVNKWLDLFYAGNGENVDLTASKSQISGNGRLRHSFSFALGDKQPAADPDPNLVSDREYTQKVKNIGREPKKTGGCG